MKRGTHGIAVVSKVFVKAAGRVENTRAVRNAAIAGTQPGVIFERQTQKARDIRGFLKIYCIR